MHNLTFQLKRCFHASLRHIEKLVEPDAGRLITPARADLMTAILSAQLHYGSDSPQARLKDILGVSCVTISRMLSRMEELGLVTRERNPDDRRCKITKLTDLGRWLLRRLKHTIIRKGTLQHRYEDATRFWPFVRKRAKRCISDTLFTLASVAVGLGDRTSLDYTFDFGDDG